MRSWTVSGFASHWVRVVGSTGSGNDRIDIIWHRQFTTLENRRARGPMTPKKQVAALLLRRGWLHCHPQNSRAFEQRPLRLDVGSAPIKVLDFNKLLIIIGIWNAVSNAVPVERTGPD
jgi:hypothetical protein